MNDQTTPDTAWYDKGRRTNLKTLQREYFSDTGLYAKWRANCDAVAELIENGMANQGTYYTHGTLSDLEGFHHPVSLMRNLVEKYQRSPASRRRRRSLPRRDLMVCLEGVKRAIEGQERFIARAFA